MLLAVFLNNKLITCDTSIPFVMDVVRINPNMDVEFYVTDVATFQSIQDNVVLWDAIHSIGKLVQLGRSEEQRKQGFLGFLKHRLNLSFHLFRLFFLGLFGRATFLHFRALNHWPLRILSIAAPKRTYVSEGFVAGYSKVEQEVDRSDRVRVDYMEKSAAQGGIIAYSPDWKTLSSKYLEAVPKYVLGNFWYGQAWPDYVQAKASGYLDKELQAGGYPADSHYIVYIMGFLGAVESVPDANTFKELLQTTLEILHREAPDTVVLLKPHFNTDVKYLQSVLDQFPNHKFVISHLHPAVLSQRARFFLANYYSSTMAVSRSYGVKNVEFSQYSEAALKAADGGSMRPDLVDYYINNDPKEFSKTVKTVLALPVGNVKITGSDDPSGVILKIAGKTA